MRKRKMSQAGGRAKKGRSTLTKRVATLERTRPKQQLKYVDVDIAFDGSLGNQAGGRITAVQQGADRVQRIGNRILVKKLEVTYHWDFDPTTDATNKTVELQIYKATDTDDIAGRSDVLGAFQDPEKYTPMHVFRDTAWGRGARLADHRKVLTTNFGIQYDGSTPTSIIGKDIGYYWKSSGGTDVRVTGTIRMWFTDA